MHVHKEHMWLPQLLINQYSTTLIKYPHMTGSLTMLTWVLKIERHNGNVSPHQSVP